jgi:hypothetical protein
MENLFIVAHVSFYDMLAKNTEVAKSYQSYLTDLNNIFNKDFGQSAFPNHKDGFNLYKIFTESSSNGKSSLKEYFSNYLFLMREARTIHVRTHFDENTDRNLQYSTVLQKAEEIQEQLITPLLALIKDLSSNFYLNRIDYIELYSIICFVVFMFLFLIGSYYQLFKTTPKIEQSLEMGLSSLKVIPISLRNFIIENIVDVKKKRVDEDN